MLQGNGQNLYTYDGGYRFFFQGDTVINSTSYKILKYHPFAIIWNPYPSYFVDTSITEIYSFLREDTTTKKIYIIDINNSPEDLFFDSTLNTGDTLFSINPGSGILYVIDTIIDVTLLNGQTRRAWYVEDGYGARIDDQSGMMFFLGNACFTPCNENLIRRNISGSSAGEHDELPPLLPDNNIVPKGEQIQNAFAMINHPKTDEMIFGMNGLHKRLRNEPLSGFPLWQRISDIYDNYYPNNYDRRVMEIAISEDEFTNYIYLATLGDNSINRRADFYVSDNCTVQNQVQPYSNCFIKKTGNLPYSTLATTADRNPVTGIAIDPLDGERVWASFSGFDSNIKVYYSDNAGDSWTNYDDGDGTLAGLNMPVNHIVYQRGTNDRLYIATDVGVYVREGNGNWERFGENFPNVRTVELKINYCSGKLRAATFGRGVWEADLLDVNDAYNTRSFRTISSNEVWDTDKNMSRDILVKAGFTLTLNNMTLNMPKSGLIVVEQGARLNVNNSTITNLCGQTWQGIQVWGNTALAQTPTNQGIISLDGSTIEYSRYGVALWQSGNYPNAAGTSGGTGGMIFANKSNFINNWRSVEFMMYTNSINIPGSISIPQRERSYFKECLFTVNDDFRPFDVAAPLSFLGHISMWGVGGTQIQGCTFNDERTNKLGDQSIGGSYGVYTIAASPIISALPVGNTYPPSSYIRNTFEGIERAVEITYLSATPFIAAVDQCDFVDNEQAVTIKGYNKARIIRNTFTIGGFDTQGNSSPSVAEEYGLGIVTATDFTVEQNTFVGTTSTTEDIAGSWVGHTGANGNTIRNNSYQNLSGGNLAHGFNHIGQFQGLQYLCNNNQGNIFDFLILPNPFIFGFPATIALNQGSGSSPIQPTRNTFTPVSTVTGQIMHLDNNNQPGVNYFYLNSGSEIPDATKITPNILIQDVSGGAIDFCDDHFTNPSSTSIVVSTGGSQSPNQLLNQLKSNYYNAAADYEFLLQKYQKLLDKGNKDSLKIVIKNTNSSNKNILKDSLMSISPYLTQESLLEAVTANLFNKNQLKDIIMENPNVVLDSAFMDTLAKVNSPLKAKDLEDIKNSPKDKLKEPKRTFKRSQLESALGMAYQELFLWANEVIYEYSNDSAGPHYDSLEVWIQHKPSLDAQYELAEHYWRQGRYQDAINYLRNIPNTHNLGKLELVNHSFYVQLKELLLTAYNNGRTEATLERSEVNELTIIAERRFGFASVQADNILRFFYGKGFAYYPILPQLRSARTNQTTDEIVVNVEPRLWGYPNPAINWVDIQYDIPSELVSENTNLSSQLIITAISGQVIQTIEVQGRQGIAQLNTTDWAGGIYFAVLVTNKTKGAVYKFVVRK